MDEPSGIELSLLEGMDEKLLVRLHRAGIRSRAELQGRIASPEARRELARELGISSRKLEALHYLNFIMPEDRAERFLVLERRLAGRDQTVNQDLRQMWRVITVLVAVVFAAVILMLAVWRPWREPASTATDAGTADRIASLEKTVEALRPLGVSHAETLILRAMQELGPAPGWNGPLPWPPSADEEVRLLLGDAPEHRPARAVSLAMARLARVESAADTLSPLDHARLAANHLADFPPVSRPADLWDVSAVLLRTRFRSRALGLVPLDSESPELNAAAAWTWTSPGFLAAEEFLARLESLPVQSETLPVWAETLGRIREAADLARDREVGRPEAFARDYWIRRSELEGAVVAALAGQSDLRPYNTAAPDAFLQQRLGFLDAAIARAPGSAQAPLAWLAVEYVEAEALVHWLAAHPDRARPASGAGWVTALASVEPARDDLDAVGRSEAVTRRVTRAAQLSGASGDPWSASRTRWETGLRPLLMATRARVREPGAVSPASH